MHGGAGTQARKARPKALALDVLGRIAVVAPHPDDETLGCGGLLARAAEASLRPPLVIAVTDGDASHEGISPRARWRLSRRRLSEQRAALAELGWEDAASVAHLHLEDGSVERHLSAAGSGFSRRLLRMIAHGQVSTVFCPSSEDEHRDHRAVALLLRRALPAHIDLYEYSIWPGSKASSNMEQGCVALDITSVLERKRRAIACFESQLGLRIEGRRGFVIPGTLLARSTRPFELFHYVRRTPAPHTAIHLR